MPVRSGKRVLITFGRSFLALDLARLLGAAGHDVMVADSVPLPISRFSRAVTKTFRTPRPTYEPLAWAHEVARIAREQRIELVIPIHEETDILAQVVKHDPGLFPEDCRLFFSEFDLEARLHNKFEFQVALQSLGTPTLGFAQVRSQEDLEAVEFGEPFALKRVYSRGSQEIYKVHPGQLPEGLRFDPDNPWLAQEWAKGANYCSYSICHNGQVKAHTVYPVRYAIDGTSCLTYEAVEHEGIAEWVRETVKAFNFTGQIGFDFIEVPGRGLFTVDCNPRATSGIMLFDPESRVDRAFFGENSDVITPAPDTRRMLGPGMLMYGWRKSSLKDNTFRGFLRDYRRTDEVIFQRRDPLPGLAIPLALGNILAEAVRFRVGIPEAFMHDHEWDGNSLPA